MVFLVFLPVLGNDFVNWDDEVNFTQNLEYRGFGASNLSWMFTALHAGHYMPLTWLTLALDYQVWGMSPAGYHLSNLLWHMANAVVFYLLILALVKLAVPQPVSEKALRLCAAAGALLFGIHPLRVESVAWATERRDMVSGLFFLLSTLAYLKYAQSGGIKWYVGSLALFAFSLLSKTAGMMLPVVLLILDVYPLARLRRGLGGGEVRKLLVEKAPFVVAMIAAMGLTILAQRKIDALIGSERYTLLDSILQPGYRLSFYAFKTAFPINLSPFYPFESVASGGVAKYALCTAGILGLTVWLARRYGKRPWALVSWLSYGVLLAPMAGVIHAGPQHVADRYSYLACLPWGVLAAGWLYHLGRGGQSRHLLAGTVLVTLIVLGILTSEQTKIWRNSLTLWTQALKLEPASSFAYYNRGKAWESIQEYDRAIADYDEILKFDPNNIQAVNNRGMCRRAKGDDDGALKDFDRAIEIAPGDPIVHVNRGLIRSERGDFDGAIADFNQVLKIAPNFAEAYMHRAFARAAKKELDAAFADYDRALDLSPNNGGIYLNRGLVLAGVGKFDAAIADIERAMKLAPLQSPLRRNAQAELDKILERRKGP